MRYTDKAKTPRDRSHEGLAEKAGDNLLSRYSHYHGPQVLNGRVRNGNGCGHLGMVTGKTNQWAVGGRQWAVKTNNKHATVHQEYQKGSGSSHISVRAPCQAHAGIRI